MFLFAIALETPQTVDSFWADIRCSVWAEKVVNGSSGKRTNARYDRETGEWSLRYLNGVKPTPEEAAAFREENRADWVTGQTAVLKLLHGSDGGEKIDETDGKITYVLKSTPPVSFRGQDLSDYLRTEITLTEYKELGINRVWPNEVFVSKERIYNETAFRLFDDTLMESLESVKEFVLTNEHIPVLVETKLSVTIRKNGQLKSGRMVTRYWGHDCE